MLTSFRKQSRNTIVLAASIGWVLAAFFAWNALLPLHLRALGATDVEIGVVFSLFILFHTIPAVAGGALADRVGRKWVAIGPGLILAPLYVVAGFTADWRILSLVLIVTNVCGAVQWPAMQAMISESDEETRATAFSLIEVFVLSAAVVGPLLGSFLLPYVGVGGLLILHGLALVPATWVRARELKETHHPTAQATGGRANWRAALTPNVLWIMSAYGLAMLALGLSAGGPFYAMLAHDVWGLGDQQIQQMLSISSLAAFGGIWLGGRADRWGSRRMWIITICGFGVTLVGWGLSPSPLAGIVFMMLNTLFFEAAFIIWETLLAHQTTAESRSFMFGLCGTIGGAAEGVGPGLGTGLITLASLPATFIAGAVVSVFGALAVVPVRDDRKAALAAQPAE